MIFSLVMVDLERAEEHFTELISEYFKSREWEVERLEVLDTVEFCDVEEVANPYEEYIIYFRIKGHKVYIHKETEEEMDEYITYELIHKQYDFTTGTMYGFFEWTSNSCCEALDDDRFEKYISDLSRGKLG